jgi:hypothetical protein
MATIRRPTHCAWVIPAHGTLCAAPAPYTVLVLSAAAATLMLGVCTTHLGPLVERSLAHPTIPHVIVTRYAQWSESGDAASLVIEPESQ